MAKPDLDDGFLQLAHELFAAVMVAQMPKEARVVLCEVFSQVYGLARAKSAHLSPTQIATRTGLAKQNINRGIAFLLKNNVLKRDGMEAYVFVKNYEAWGADGEPLMSPRLSAYAAFAPDLARANRAARPPRPTPSRPENAVIETDYRSVGLDHKQRPIGNRSEGVLSSKRITPLLIGDRDIQQQQRGEAVISAASSEIESDDAALEPFESPAAEPIPAAVDTRPAPAPGELRRPFRPDPFELDRITTWVVATLGNDNPAAIGIGYVKAQFPLDWIEAAILEALAVPGMRPEGVWRYASRCLASWWDAGGRPKAEVRPARAADADPFGPSASPRTIPLTPAQERRRLQREAYSNPAPDPAKESR